MAKSAQKAAQEKECCVRTRARWAKRISEYYNSFPVIKDVPCDRCKQILEIRVFDDENA